MNIVIINGWEKGRSLRYYTVEIVFTKSRIFEAKFDKLPEARE